ncbi:MAG: pectinesterase family protein [Proteiniphilum sp.]|jgi:pectinesterase|uniref:pectinesterase family protein n=1 Tax=Proteiniphilum sp. TaxID=1926877 RepID=UPI002B208DD0|nr:pectinesterase family protein [Proteiniphilum sp.]MEA5128487.1 pectinesterase family protein [Proteiniphilum sp.]
MMKIFQILFFVVFSILSLAAQTVMINGLPRDTSYTVWSSYQKEVKRFPFIRIAEAKVAGDMKVYPGMVYKTVRNTKYGDRELRLSVYRPADDRDYPVVMMIYGGGWNSGSQELQEALAIHLSQKGFATVTVEYRLSPEQLYPAAMDDLNDAVSWISRNAREYGFDAGKIAVSGCSAGGQMAALIGTRNRDNFVKAVINIDGISTFIEKENVDRSEKARSEGAKLPADATWLGGTYSEKPETWKDASPLYWVGSHSAPVCFINSSIPRFHNGRDEHIRLLDSLGIYSEKHTFEDTPHTFWHFHPWHLSTVNLMADFLWKLFDEPTVVDSSRYDIMVAQDGTGDFRTVQEAVNAVPDFRKQPTRIFIRNGFYREKIVIPDTKQNITLVGEDKYKTILSYNNYASKKSLFGDEIGTSGSASVYVCPDLFRAENITFENAAGPVGQAVAIIVRSDRAQFHNCRFLGFQDTLYTHKPFSRQYYVHCYIEGTVDFIFGASTAWFEECEIVCKENGYVTAASTPQDVSFGYVFHQCRITGERENSFFLGRPWRPYAHVAFIECELSDVIKPEGWNNWGKVENESTARYVEYGNRGEGAATTARVKWSQQFTGTEAQNYVKEKVLGSDFWE